MTVDTHSALIGPYGWIFVGCYICLLLAIGVLGRFAREEESLADHYLSGRTVGPFVLFLTLYATQYSGNTLIGFAGRAYRQGYVFLISITAMMAVIGGYFLFAPRLHALSKKHGFVTIGDYVQHRFHSDRLTIAVTLISIVALSNYILSNLKAIGYIVEASTGGVVSFAHGIIFLSVVMVLYETLGGLRSVAWTDVIQGLLLLVGCIIIFVAIEYQYGGLSQTAEVLMSSNREFWTPPSLPTKWAMLSTLLLFFFGISVYPHAIQRIYAARSSRTLRRSLQVMVFMPLVTTFFMVVVGVVGAAQFPGLDKQQSERITLYLLLDMAENIPGVHALVVVFVTAAAAAIMSTVDSALLAISSLFTQDIYRRFAAKACQSHLTRIGKVFSWLVIALMSVLAITLPETIWRLIEIKLELLCQLAPAVFLGIHSRSLHRDAVFWGLISGTAFSLFFQFANMAGFPVQTKPLGIHAGIWGLLLNVLVVLALSQLKSSRTKLELRQKN